MTSSFTIRPEQGADSATICALHDIIFGAAQKVRAAYALREGVAHEMPLAFVAQSQDRIIATVRQTKISIDKEHVLLLGPLGVHPEYKSQGIGRALMQTSMDAAKSQTHQGAPHFVLLVGDLDYYQPFGFQPTEIGSIFLPRPADPARILLCPLDKEQNRPFPKGRTHSHF